MKLIRLYLFVGAAVALALAPTLSAQDVESITFPKLNELQTPEIDRITLDNGMRIYLLEDKSLPIVHAAVRINCGSYLEPADKIGLASLTGAVLRTGGTKKWTGDQLDEMLEGIGGAVETNIGLTQGGANVNLLSEYAELGLEVLADILRNPVFSEDKIDLAKVQARTGISRRNDDPASIARREFSKQIYGADSPYARHSEYATIDAITRDDLIAYHGQFFRPENMQLSVWGDIDRDAIRKLIEKYFGDWAAGGSTVPPPPKVDYEFRSKVYYVEKADAKQSYIRVGHIGGLVSDPDYADRIVMNSIVGGGFGSRLTNAVRTEMGLAYSVGGRYISNFAYPGYFFAVASTAPENTIKATREMIRQTKSMLTDLPTEEEMYKGKDGYLNSFVFNFDSRGEVINRMMTYDFHGMPEDFLQQEKERVENVTPEDVMAAAKRNLHPDEMVVLVSGNADDFDLPLDSLGLGPVDTIDITIPSGEKKRELDFSPENLKKGAALLASTIDAHGGLDNFKAITALSSKGTMTLVMGGQSIPLPIEEIRVLPNKSFTKVTFMGQEIFDIRDEAVGWRTDQSQGTVVPKTEVELAKEDKESARITILIFQSSDAPDYQTVYDGPGEVDGTAVEFVVIADATGEVICRFGFSASTNELISKSYWGETMRGEGNIEEVFLEFTESAGVKLPSTVERRVDGEKFATTALSELIVNPEVPAGAFAPPQ